MGIKSILVTHENVGLMREIFKRTFPTEQLHNWTNTNGEQHDCFDLAINHLDKLDYYLAYDAETNNLVGHYGLYVEQSDPESSFLGWFGVLPEYRRQHYGTQICDAYIELAKQQNFKFARLYTGRLHNDAALAFYISYGFVLEPYTNERDIDDEQLVIGTISLGDYPVELWNNRHLDF